MNADLNIFRGGGMTIFVFGKNNTHIQHHLGQANFVVPLTPNIQLRMQELKASTAMPCVLAMIAIVAAFSGLILSTSPTSAQQVSGQGGAGGQHAISPPRAGGSGAAATSYSGGGGGGGGGKNATSASGGIGGHGGSGPHARGGGVGGSYNSPGHYGTKGADGVGKGWIWAPGNFGHDGGSGGGGGGGGSPSPLPSGLIHNISNSMVGGVGGTGGNGAVGGIGYSAAYFPFSSYWDGTGGGGGAGGGGGGGGAGLYFTSSTQGYLPADQVAANISANIIGGTGGDGGYGGDGGAGETRASKNYAVGGDGGSGGNGGNGGAGILAGGYIASLYLTAGTAVSGGSGGKGGNGGWGGNSDYASNYNLGNGGNGGNGGVGGTGIVLGGLNADHSNIILGEGASVKGGQGGDRGFRGDHGSVQEGTMSPSNGKPGLAGKGGQGIWLNSGADLRIDVGKGAVIQGGDGSTGGIGIEGSASQSIVGVAGIVSGGLGSDGTRADAISINGTDNVLQLRNGYQLVGEVNLGTDVMLSLAGSENATFDLTTIGTQYLGLSHLLKQDGSTWTLNGKSSSRFADVSVSAGRLVVGSQSDLKSDIGFVDGGEVAVNGNGTADSAKWTVDQSLLVGNINTGSLEISDGGTVKVGKDLLIGENNSVSGMVNITGSQSKLTVGGMLAVGDSGQGTMTVSDGAQVQSGKVAIGRNSGSTGSVVVTGTGTKWTAQEIFVSGGNVDNDGGHGSLTISDGATIGAPRGFIDVGDHGAYGVVNIGAAEGENAVAPGFFVGSDLLLAPFTDAVFNHNATDYSFDASISGFANLKFLSGTTKLTGDSALFNGNATVTNSTLDMAERAKLGGTLTVDSAGRLEGSGQVETTIINAGGTLAPSGTRSMTINGDLTLNSGGAFLPSDTASLIVNGNATFNSGAAYNYNLAVGGIATSATTVVNGNVALNGTTLNISGEPAIGYHRLISYTGSLTQENGGLNVGSTPDTTPFGYNYAIDTSVSRSVDLLVSPQGLNILQLWDGGIPGGNNQDGTWNTASQNWSDPIGGTADTTWGHGYAIFRGFGGLVTIEGAQSAVGLQFAGGNYRVDGSSGATLNLVGYSGPGLEIDVPEIRVLNNEGAVISADITGTSGLEKTGDGLLVLWGNNTYSGNTYVSGGILQIASMQNLGASSNTLIIDNAMLRTANSFDMTQAITLGGVSTINVLLGEEMKLSGGVTGDGMLFKDGGGTLLLSGANSWSGGTWINDGTLRIEEGNYSAIAYNSDYVITGGLLDLNGMDLRMRSLIGSDGEISINASTLTIAQDTDTIFAGRITGNNFDSNLIKTGSGMLVLTGNNSYYGSTTIYGGSLAISDARNIGLNSGSSRLEINNNTALITLADIELNRQVTLVGNATINTIFGTTLELSGPVTGSLGTLYKDGAGRLIISGNGTYGQGTVIAGGILQIGDGGTTGSLTGNIANNSLLAFDRSNTYTYNGVISGEGAVLQAGSGTTILTGDHSYTGNTFITSGTLQVGNGGETGSIGGYVLNDGTLAFNRSDDYTFSGLIIGTGALVQAGSGTLILDADNYYTSGTSIESGTLQIGSGGKSGWITGDVANDGTLAFNRSDAFEFAGKVSGTGGFQQKGEGAVILTGDSSYTGATDVLAGRLAVNGSIDSSILTTVYEGAELGGNGTVGQTFVNGGTLAPGNSIGTLNVAGDLQLTASSTYQVEVSPTNSDKVNVSGQADLGGATVQAMFDPGAYIMKRYNILSADGGFSGTTFGEEVTTDLPENFASLLRYDANNVYLDVEMSIGGLNVNQQNVSTALVNYFDENGQIPVAFGALDADGLSAVSGELATAAQQTTVDAMSQFMNTLADPLVTGRAGRITKSQVTDASAFENRWSVWGAGYGSARSTDGNATIGSHDTRGRVYGVAVGADYLVSPDTIIGFAVAGGGTKFSLADGMGSGDSDLFQAGIYGRHNIGNAYITGALAYGWQSIDTERTVSFYEADQLNGSYRANSWSGRLEAGYRFETPWLGITPYAAGQFVSFDLPSYSEKTYAGSDTYALSYSSQKETVGRSELGLSLDKSIALSDGVFTARGRLAWARNFNNERNVFAAINALPGGGFVVNGASQPKDVGLASISAEMSWTNGLSLGAAFDAEFSASSANYAGKGVLRYKW